MKRNFEQALKRALEAPYNIPVSDLTGMLSCNDGGFLASLYSAANALAVRLGKKTLKRALIEVSNVCSRSCYYCGIRKSETRIERYSMSEGEVLAAVAAAREEGFEAVAFQAGEIESEKNSRFYETILDKLGDVEITLSLGEQETSVYERWKKAAGEKVLRYLLRIETSNKDLFAKIHPPGASFERRIRCIRDLKRLGFITGSGVMIGLPGQTYSDLANDILFFADERLDMVGMGPYIPCEGTMMEEPQFSPKERYELSLKMIALTRLYLWDVNIVSSTALETLSRGGRQAALCSGANVIMPNFTPEIYRCQYRLYPGKHEVVS